MQVSISCDKGGKDLSANTPHPPAQKYCACNIEDYTHYVTCYAEGSDAFLLEKANGLILIYFTCNFSFHLTLNSFCLGKFSFSNLHIHKEQLHEDNHHQ